MNWRGGEQQLVYLVEGLKNETNSLIVCPQRSLLAHYAHKNMLPVTTMSKRRPFHPLTWREFGKIVREFKPHIIHLHDPDAHAIAVIWASMTRSNIPMVLSRKVDFKLKNSFFTRYKYNFKNVKVIVCVSKAVKEIILPSIKRQEKISVIYDAVDVNRFSDKPTGALRRGYKLPDDMLIVGNIAALVPHKDYITFINTAERVIHSGVKAKFFVIGDGPQKEKLAKMIQDRGLGKHFIVTGFRNDIEQVFPDIDVFLHPSETEGLGSSILDAFLCRSAVVATNAGGIIEIVKHNETGLIADVKDSEKLAEYVMEMAKNHSLRTKLTNNAFQFVQQFSTHHFSQHHLSLYNKILSKNR
jgi:glycosyltransferase involved in cell wall biosynthesis